MTFSTFEELLCIVGLYLVVDYYQSLRRSKGIPPPSPATMLQCALLWRTGSSYHHIRVITGVSTATFCRIVYRVMFAINDSDKLAPPRFPSTTKKLNDTAAAFRSCSDHGVIENCIGVIELSKGADLTI
ncbi:hypothetical protein PHMEG_00013168 [Phytophthora megakarya]|uniref:Uncharacterized protein n=1 Tax=Phytophthora megakarya TaxID=4795 RepID=A0A225W6W2_9STRA|nr:hypothetical protein PHMEG_00013168 [Phytophthora megakarya]